MYVAAFAFPLPGAAALLLCILLIAGHICPECVCPIAKHLLFFGSAYAFSLHGAVANRPTEECCGQGIYLCEHRDEASSRRLVITLQGE